MQAFLQAGPIGAFDGVLSTDYMVLLLTVSVKWEYYDNFS